MARRRSHRVAALDREPSAMTRLLDTHCHLDAYPDARTVLIEARRSEVDLVAVTETPDGYRRLKTRLGRAPGVAVALGLHPASAAAAAPGQQERFFRMMPDASWIGEIGLDFPTGVGRREKVRQVSLFQAVLDHDMARIKPMTIHSRGASSETVRRLGQSPSRAVLHWYSGSLGVADEALAAGLWFSVNPAMTRSSRGRALIGRLPRDRVLCETDGPYCKAQGREATPSDVRLVVRDLAGTWECTVEDATQLIVRNTTNFLAGAPVRAAPRPDARGS
jgi:TatD DNase family protein